MQQEAFWFPLGFWNTKLTWIPSSLLVPSQGLHWLLLAYVILEIEVSWHFSISTVPLQSKPAPPLSKTAALASWLGLPPSSRALLLKSLFYTQSDVIIIFFILLTLSYLIFIFIYLAVPGLSCSMGESQLWHVRSSSPARDWTHVLCSRSTAS